MDKNCFLILVWLLSSRSFSFTCIPKGTVYIPLHSSALCTRGQNIREGTINFLSHQFALCPRWQNIPEGIINFLSHQSAIDSLKTLVPTSSSVNVNYSHVRSLDTRLASSDRVVQSILYNVFIFYLPLSNYILLK